jgi:FSR family fosmidomycin resistance protein-like MFS transporter
VGLLVAGVGIGLAGLGDSYWWTWAAVALSGLGVAAYHPAAARAARAAAGASAQGMSWFAVGGNAGLALGPVVVTPVLLAYGVAGTPLLALPALVMAAVLLALGRRARTRPRPATAAGGAPPRADDWRSFGWLTGLVVIRSVLYFGVSSLVALYVIDRFGVTASAGSAALATFLGVGALGTLAGGWLADRWGRVQAIRLGHAVTVPGLVLLVAAPSWPVALAAAVCWGSGSTCPSPCRPPSGRSCSPTGSARHRVSPSAWPSRPAAP